MGAGVSWKVEATTNPSGFLAFPGTVTASNGSSAASSAGADGAVLTIVYGQNNGPERDAILTFEAVDGDGNSYTPAATHEITITQLGALPTLLVRQTGGPDVTALSANAEVTYAVTIGGGAESWSASVTRNPGGFLKLDEEGTGFRVEVDRTTLVDSRIGAVRVTTIGGSGFSADTVLFFRQVGTRAGGVSARSTPNLNQVQYVPATAGEILFVVSLSGSATGWTAALNSEALFYSLDKSSGRHGDALVVSYAAHTGADERKGTLTLTSTGGTGTGTATFEIEQIRGSGPLLEVLPPVGVDFEALPAEGGTILASVELLRGAEDWTTTEQFNPGDFLTIGTKDGTNATQTLTLEENTGVARLATVLFTSSGGGAAFVHRVLFLQLGATPTLSASVALTSGITNTAVPAVPTGERTATARIALGGGAERWRAVLEDPDGFFASTTSLRGDRTNNSITITYNVNEGVGRRAKIIFTSTGLTAVQATEELIFVQLGAAPTIDVSTNVADLTAIPAAPTGGGATGTITATITLGGGAEGFTVAKSDDDSDAFIESFTPAGGDRVNNRVTITYKENTGMERNATLTFTTTGGTGTEVKEVLVLRQEAAAPAIAEVTAQNKVTGESAVDFLYATEKLAAASTGIISATIALGGGATGWETAKDGDTGNVFITSFTDNSGSSAVLEIAYSVNGGVDERSATINITPTGADGTKGAVFPLVITQAGAPTITVGSVTDGGSSMITPTGTNYSVSSSAQTLTVPINLMGSAENVSYTASVGSFLTSVTKKTGPLRYEIVYDANAGVQRAVTLTFEAQDGSSNSFSPAVTTAITITQAAGPPAITVGSVTDAGNTVIMPTGANYSVSSSAQTLTVPIELTGAAENVDYAPQTGTFLTSVTKKTGPLRYEIVYDANAGVQREVTLTFEAEDGSSNSFSPAVTTAITITQAAGPPAITVGSVTDAGNTVIMPTGANYSVSSSAQTLTVPINLTGTAVNVSHSPPVSGTFLTSVTKLTSPSLRYEIVFEANTTAVARDVTLTFEAEDGSSNSFSPAVTTAITITQAAGTSHTFVATPTYTPVLVGGSLTAVGGTISTTFALGGGATGWEATEALDYVELTPTNGDAITPVVVSYDANDTFVARDVVISITTTGPTGVSITDDVSISQEGAQGITVVTVPAVVSDLSTVSGSIDVDVTLSGSATGWSATEAATNPAGFLTLGSASGAGTDVLTISYEENADAALRTATVTLTATGGRGTAQDTVLTISQLGTGPNVVVGAPTGEDFLALPAAGGTIVAEVALTGGALDWDAVAEASNPANFLTVGTKDVTNGEQSIAYAANAGVSRTGTVTFTTSGGAGAPAVREVNFRQLGALPTIDVSTSPSDLKTIPASPAGGTGTITGTITLGGGAEGWTATKSDDDSDAFISDFTASGDRDNLTLTITYNANTGVGRTATLTLTTTGGTGVAATADLVITQAAAGAATITVGTVTDGDGSTITPTGTNYEVSSSAQILTVPIELTAPAVNVDYSPKTGTFLTSVTEQSSPLRYEIVFGENTGVQRAVTLTFEGLDGSDASFSTPVTTEITITQLAAALTIAAVTTTNTVGSAGAVSFDPMADKLAAASTGTITATITLGGGATVWEASKFGDTGGEFITNFTTSGDGSTTLDIAYSANTDVFDRIATINIIPRDADGARGSSFQLVLTQLAAAAAAAAITVGDVTDADDMVITPTGTNYAVSSSAQTLTVPIELTAPAVNVDYSPKTGTFLTSVTEQSSPLRYEIVFGENTGVQRAVTLTFEGLDGSDASFSTPVTTEITITQLAAALTIAAVTTTNTVGSASAVSFDPTADKLAAASTGTITATITLGGGATVWEASKFGDTGGEFITNFTTSGDGSTALDIAYSANTDVFDRIATINIIPRDADGARGSSFQLVLTQLAAAAAITVGDVTDADDTIITPTGTNYEVSSSAQTLTVLINLTAPAVNVDYSPKTGTFLTSVTEQPSPLGYEIVFDANTGGERSVTLTFEGLDGSDASFSTPVTTEITITQLAAAPTIDVSTSVPDLAMIPASPSGATGTITATITLGGGAEGWTATKSNDDSDAFIESFTPASGDRSNLTLTITYKENTGAARTATLTLTTTGGTGAAATADLVITQLGESVLRVPTLLSSFRLYPNPAQGSFVVETEFSDARISIQHVHGGELLRISLQRGRNELDISHLPAGVYVLTLTTSQGSTSTRLIKAE